MCESPVQKLLISTKNCGSVTVFIHGTKRADNSAILTVHDLGCNASTFMNFVDHPSMEQLKKRFMWIHVTLPGQNKNESDLNIKFPDFNQISEDLNLILENQSVLNVIVIGDGAGAHILSDFVIKNNNRTYGAIFINLVSGTENFINRTTRKISIGSKLEVQGMIPAAVDYLVKHRFGNIKDSDDHNLLELVQVFSKSLHTEINSKNLHYFIDAYNNRLAMRDQIAKMQCPSLFVVGSESQYCGDVSELHYQMQKSFEYDPIKRSHVELVNISGVANVMSQRPDRLAEFMQYFLQGLGLGGSLVNRRISLGIGNSTPGLPSNSFVDTSDSHQNIQRVISMQEYDKPKGKQFFRKISMPSDERVGQISQNI